MSNNFVRYLRGETNGEFTTPVADKGTVLTQTLVIFLLLGFMGIVIGWAYIVLYKLRQG
jgi:H+/Cl- antiporter ClcA